jgi:hypothetical protein
VSIATVVTEGLAYILRVVKSAMRRRAVTDLPEGEKLVKETEASVAEVDRLATGVVK